MDGWIELDPDCFEQRRELNTANDGIEVTLYVSPYDVPGAVRIRRDPKGHRFVIEFRYVEDEPVVRRLCGDLLSLRSGAHSGRLLGIEIDLLKGGFTLPASPSKPMAGEVLRPAIECVESHVMGPRHNYAIAAQILKLRSEDLLASTRQVYRAGRISASA